MAKKAFNELTERGQKQRLAKYEKERAARGAQETLARLVKPAKIKSILEITNLQYSVLLLMIKQQTKQTFSQLVHLLLKAKKRWKTSTLDLQKVNL